MADYLARLKEKACKRTHLEKVTVRRSDLRYLVKMVEALSASSLEMFREVLGEGKALRVVVEALATHYETCPVCLAGEKCVQGELDEEGNCPMDKETGFKGDPVDCWIKWAQQKNAEAPK